MPPAPKPPSTKPKPKPASYHVEADLGVKTKDKRYINQGLFPGLMVGDTGGINAYNRWLTDIVGKSEDQATLVSRGGAGVQALLWRAHLDHRDPNDTLNEIADTFGTDIFKGGGGGGGGRGGGGGGGSGAPTPEQIESTKAEVRNRASTLGRPLTDDEVTWIATKAANEHWTGAQLDDNLLSDPTKITQPGLVQVSIEQIKQMGAQQLMNVSDDTAREWANRINSGEMDPTAVASIFHGQALAEFGWAAQGLNSGLTMRDILMPARDKIASELEIGADTIDFMDPKYRQMATGVDDKGQPRAATMTEVTRAARKDAQWAKTNNAARLAANTAQLLRQTFEGA